MTLQHTFGRARFVVPATLALGAIVALAGAAFAGHLTSDVTSYTGCLAARAGTISNIQSGDEPLRECGAGSTEVHFSGGDISAISAGTGLSGGGDNGAVGLSLATSYRLPQGCAAGQLAAWNGTGWSCSDAAAGGGAGGTTMYFDSRSELVHLPGDESAVTVLSVDVPAGTYLVTAVLGIETDGMFCRINPGGINLATRTAPSLSMMDRITLPSPGSITVECRLTPATYRGVVVDRRLAALPVTSL